MGQNGLLVYEIFSPEYITAHYFCENHICLKTVSVTVKINTVPVFLSVH